MDILKLCLVTNIFNETILKAIHGGITAVQLRDKTKDKVQFRQLALRLKSSLCPFKIPLIINDHVDIAKEIDAEGVHLGQSDMSPWEARNILGPKKIIGCSVESMEELEIANQLDCINYIAASAVFPSKNKLDCKHIWGLTGLKRVTQLSKHPVLAIGGINLNNIRAVMESGVCGAAVISAIHDAEDPSKAASDLMREINLILSPHPALPPQGGKERSFYL